MKLPDATWTDVEAFDREAVVVIPTGALEQHGPHLPLFTDTLIVTAVAESVERRLPGKVLLCPTLWMGASGHHLAFCGTLSADFDAYGVAIESVAESLIPHGYHKFYILNGHGGNREPNGIAVRKLKARHREATFGHASYYDFARDAVARVLEGPLKELRHACEAETSLMMHLHPHLVRLDKRRNDGLVTEPPLAGVVHHFDEITEQGSFGFSPLATAEKGRIIFGAAVDGSIAEIETLANGYVLRGS